ncbi:unnamed protein product, partial [Staurois parvus]
KIVNKTNLPPCPRCSVITGCQQLKHTALDGCAQYSHPTQCDYSETAQLPL